MFTIICPRINKNCNNYIFALAFKDNYRPSASCLQSFAVHSSNFFLKNEKLKICLQSKKLIN